MSDEQGAGRRFVWNGGVLVRMRMPVCVCVCVRGCLSIQVCECALEDALHAEHVMQWRLSRSRMLG